MSATRFAAQLTEAETRLRAAGLSGRAAWAALCRHLARRLDLPRELWLDGPDAPPEAGLDRIALTAELDFFGLAYERFFPEVFKAERGQFFTPRPIVELMADLAGLRPGERVLDPTAGSGSFLVVAHGRGCDVDGIEIDPELVALCRLNLKLHGANPRAIRQADLFREPEDDAWDVVLANPPFSVPIDHPDALRRFALAAGRRSVGSDELFVEAAWRRLRPGGRLAVVLPHSVLANARFAPLRAWIDERFERRAIVSLPEGAFRPFGGAAARAAIVVLQKRPAAVEPWVCAVVNQPGYDPRRRVFRRTEPDELALLRIALREGRAPRVGAGERRWQPEDVLARSGIAPGVPTTTLGSLARHQPTVVRPEDRPDDRFTEVDLADVDRATGEVTRARARPGRDFKGPKTGFREGDLIFSRMRPANNKVALARRPDPALPFEMCGSSEWMRLLPVAEPHFVLIAARSSFAREQLVATAGQTRPRVRARDVLAVELPLPGPAVRERVERIARRAHALRARERRRLDRLAELYEQFGAGRIDEAAFEAALAELEEE